MTSFYMLKVTYRKNHKYKPILILKKESKVNKLK